MKYYIKAVQYGAGQKVQLYETAKQMKQMLSAQWSGPNAAVSPR